MIELHNGKYKTTRTKAEKLQLETEDIKRLTAEERLVLEMILQQGDQLGLISKITTAEFIEQPVGIEQFLTDPFYLGETCGTLYPKQIDVLKQVFEGQYTEVLLLGSIGWGKTFIASAGLCYVLYWLSCLKDPQRSLGLAPGSQIAIVIFSVNLDLASRASFDNIAQKIKASPYFQSKFPFKATQKHLRFPKNVWVLARASSDAAVISLNVLAAMLDEANFLHARPDKNSPGNYIDFSDFIYRGITRRIKSRFARKGRVPGVFFLVSSKGHREDFTTRRLKDASSDPTVLAIDFASWEVRPELYGKARFTVFVGNERARSRILTKQEAVEFKEKQKMDTSIVLLEAPEDFRSDFETDLDGAIRDYGGVSVMGTNVFIGQQQKIKDAITATWKHPYSTEELCIDKPGEFKWNEMVALFQTRENSLDNEAQLRPILNPMAIRHVHVDTSATYDATGLCMAHIGRWVDVRRRNKDGTVRDERAPVYYIDLLLRIVPSPGNEIILGDVRQIIYDLSSHGYRITKVTMDTWQSRDGLQQLKQQGYTAEVLSLDTMPDHYDNLKLALYEDRVVYYEYPKVLWELAHLKEDRRGDKRKIDHPMRVSHARGSKDVADALGGVCSSLRELNDSATIPLAAIGMGPQAGPEQRVIAHGYRMHPDTVVEKPQAPMFPFLPFIGGGLG